MQKIIQIHPCLLKLSRKQESVTDGRTDRQTDGLPILIYPSPLLRRDNNLHRSHTLGKPNSPKVFGSR
jgi:hypothetical protein